MEKPRACFCSPGVMVFRQALSFKDEGARHGYTTSTFRSPNFPESWDDQWFIEIGASSSHFLVSQTAYGKSPSATFAVKFGNLAPITLKWPAKRASAMQGNFPKGYSTSHFMCDHAFTMSVTLTLPLEGQYTHLAKNQCFEFHEQFKGMFENQIGCDVTIVASDGQMTAHWAVLAARSPFFSAMTKSDYKEKQENKIAVQISSKTCKQMLYFIYSNQTEITQEEEGRELLKAGDIYLVDGLKVAAETFLCSLVTASNAVELLILSHLHNAKQLKVKAMDVILEISKSAVEHERFVDFSKYPDLVAELVSHLSSKMA